MPEGERIPDVVHSEYTFSETSIEQLLVFRLQLTISTGQDDSISKETVQPYALGRIYR